MQSQQQWNGYRPENRKILKRLSAERMISTLTLHPSVRELEFGLILI